MEETCEEDIPQVEKKTSPKQKPKHAPGKR